MFLKPKSFEQTLRGGIVPAVPAAPGSGLNPSFHRGCTGKAHACGTNKSTKPAPSATKSQRKNSISSETISESGSENSSSWPITTTTPPAAAAAAGVVVPPPKPPRLSANRQHAKETIAPVLVRNTPRTRSLRQNGKNQNSTAAATTATTTTATVAATTPTTVATTTATSVRPPWNSSAIAASKYTATAAPHSPLLGIRNSYRRRRDAHNAAQAQWPAIWANALGCNYKNYDANLRQKVRRQNVTLHYKKL